MTKEQQAYKLGKKAFAAGKICAPAMDAKCMSLLKGNKVGEGLEILAAWQKGWIHADLQEGFDFVNPPKIVRRYYNP